MRVVVVAAPAGTAIASISTEVGKADICYRQAKQGTIGAVPIGGIITTAIVGIGIDYG